MKFEVYSSAALALAEKLEKTGSPLLKAYADALRQDVAISRDIYSEEARRVFAEQSLKLLPEARRTAREFWGLVEVLEQRYVETIGEVWSLFQKALIVDVDCYLRALEVNNVEELIGFAIECHDKLLPLSSRLKRGVEWLKMDYMNEVKRGYIVSGDKVYLPVDVFNELEKLMKGYVAVKRRAVVLSRVAVMEPPPVNSEFESSLLGAWKAYERLIRLQIGVLIRYPEGVDIASQYLECAVEFLRYMSILAKTIRSQEKKIARLEACMREGSCSGDGAGELALRREFLELLRFILMGKNGDSWKKYRNATIAALELVPIALVYGWAPTFYFSFLDRVSNALLDSMHVVATYVCMRAKELLGEQARELWSGICFGEFVVTMEKIVHEKGPIRSILSIREKYNKKLLEEGASTLEKQLIEKEIL